MTETTAAIYLYIPLPLVRLSTRTTVARVRASSTRVEPPGVGGTMGKKSNAVRMSRRLCLESLSCVFAVSTVSRHRSARLSVCVSEFVASPLGGRRCCCVEPLLSLCLLLLFSSGSRLVCTFSSSLMVASVHGQTLTPTSPCHRTRVRQTCTRRKMSAPPSIGRRLRPAPWPVRPPAPLRTTHP